MDEIWKDCYGWENFYEVSSHGRVKSKKRPVTTRFGIAMRGGIILSSFVSKTGYVSVNLTGNNIRKQELVHRLVLFAFCGIPQDGFQACHKNGVRTDNNLINLRWGSILSNHKDKYEHGTAPIGSKNPHSRLNEDQAKIVKYSGRPLKELAKEYDVSFGCVDKIRYGQTWKHI